MHRSKCSLAFRGLPHSPQSVLTAVHRLALVRLELFLNSVSVRRSERGYGAKLHVAVLANAKLGRFSHDPKFSLGHWLSFLYGRLALAAPPSDSPSQNLDDFIGLQLIVLAFHPVKDALYDLDVGRSRCHADSLRRLASRSSPVEIKRHHYPLPGSVLICLSRSRINLWFGRRIAYVWRQAVKAISSRTWYSPVQEAYMSEEQTRDNKAAILLELDENASELDKWRARAREMADSVQLLSDRLSTTPETIVFSGEETDLAFQSTKMVNASDADLVEIRTVRDNIRKLELRRRALERNKEAYRI